MPPHLTNVATLPCEMSEFKNAVLKYWIDRIAMLDSATQIIVEIYFSSDDTIIQFSDKDILSGHAKISNHLLYATATRKKKMPRQKDAVK